MRPRDFSIGVKLSLSFAVIIAIFLALVWYQVDTLDRLETLQSQTAARAEISRELATVRRTADHFSMVIADAMINRNMQATQTELAQAQEAAQQDMQQVANMAEGEEEMQLAQEFAEKYNAYLDLFEQQMLPILLKEQSVLEDTRSALTIKDIVIRVSEAQNVFDEAIILGEADAAAKALDRLRAIAQTDIKLVTDMAKDEWEKESAQTFATNITAYIEAFQGTVLPLLLQGAATDNPAMQAAVVAMDALRANAITALYDLNIALEVRQEEVAEQEQKLLELDARSDELRQATSAPLERLVETFARKNTQAQQRFATASDKAANTSMIAAGAAVVLAAFFAVLVVSVISRPLKLGTRFALKVARGEIDESFSVKQNDEVGQICQAMGQIADSLQCAIREFDSVVQAIERGRLLQRGVAGECKGAFERLINGANTIADTFVEHIDSIPLPLLAMDTEFTIIYANRTACEVAGVSQEEMLGRKCHEFMHGDDCDGGLCACKKAMEALERRESETRVRPQGQEADISYTGVPIKDASGKVYGVFEIVVDQTEIKAVQATIQSLAQDASGIADDLAQASRELADEVESTSQGAQKQMQRATETATAMEEMNETVVEVARNASDAAENAGKASSSASEGQKTVDQVIDAIGQVHTAAATLKGSMDELGQRVEDIGTIMTVINDIADQTNLLALNAAIEAARAGEAGRGFAVVADEVRKLAEKTMSATKEVAGAINSIQDVAHSSIEATDTATRAIDQSQELASQSGAKLNEIVAMADGTADQIRAIATASEEQASVTEHIATSTGEIHAISEQTAHSMRQSSDSVRNVEQLAASLLQLIERMRTR